MRSAKFMPELLKQLDKAEAFSIRSSVLAPESVHPIKDRHAAIIILKKENLSDGHACFNIAILRYSRFGVKSLIGKKKFGRGFIVNDASHLMEYEGARVACPKSGHTFFLGLLHPCKR